MSEKRMIIRNCPAILRITKVCDDYRTTRDNPQLCKDCTDCVMKQIVTECKNAKIRANDYARNPYSGGIYDEANRILDFLDIQEVE